VKLPLQADGTPASLGDEQKVPQIKISSAQFSWIQSQDFLKQVEVKKSGRTPRSKAQLQCKATRQKPP